MVQHVKRQSSLLRNGFLLHHDNARPHIARCVLDVSQQNNVEILPHPPCSLDLTPCDFWLVPQLKKPLRGKRFATTRGLLATDHVILNHGQVTWTTPELAPPLLTTTPHQREDVSALDRFNVHRCPTRRVFSGTGLDPVAKQATVRYLYHSATAATHRP
ncbi:uncharacterized protein TNCV_3099321 [Trichonephila clavipes]|nr:uncharacterized protein TNCV_3099321 [Trichonephila clavipes]